MIAMLRGALVEKGIDHVLVDVGGVGYRVAVSLSTLAALPAVGHTATLHTELIVREDSLSLVGFATVDERAAFDLVTGVQGIGPKLALSILSTLEPHQLAAAVRAGDPARLTRIPGIGKKTAERLVLELRDRLPVAVALTKAGTTPGSDVLNALMGLGYNDREAQAAVKQLPPDLALTDAIRQALKLLAKP